MCHFLSSSPARKILAISPISGRFLPSQLRHPPALHLPEQPPQRPPQTNVPCKSPQLNSLRLHSRTPNRRLYPLWNAEIPPPRLPAPESTPCSAYKSCCDDWRSLSDTCCGFDFVFFWSTPPFRVRFLKRWGSLFSWLSLTRHFVKSVSPREKIGGRGPFRFRAREQTAASRAISASPFALPVEAAHPLARRPALWLPALW
jgi:hypothetical protein